MTRSRANTMKGPAALFAAWTLHDLEEAIAFPSTTAHLAELTGRGSLRMTTVQSAAAVGLMGGYLGVVCLRGARTHGRSRLYRYAVAGLEAHVFTHLLSSLALRRYTAGVATAVPIMWPGAAYARKELDRAGIGLRGREWYIGAATMAAAALLCQTTVRVLTVQKT